MTRPEAIEAAAEMERDYEAEQFDVGDPIPSWGQLSERGRDSYREEAERYYGFLAPLIESALLDRIEKLIKTEQATLPTHHREQSPFERGYGSGLAWVRDRLAEIREGQ